jgi:hypothetical protein
MPYYLVFGADGALTGSGFAADDLAIPQGAIPCTSDQFSLFPNLALIAGSIVSVPAVPTVPIVAPSALVQAAHDAIAAGVTVHSTGTPSINGVYPCSGQTWEYLKSEATFIATFGGFSTGKPTVAFTLPSGRVEFASTALMLEVVKAVGMYLTSLAAIVASAPEPVVTIA